MSADFLAPGDIVKGPFAIGLVVTNDDLHGLLVAYPEMDELTIARAEDLVFVTTIHSLEEFADDIAERMLRKFMATKI